MTISEGDVKTWMTGWVAAIRGNDFEAGREMFADDVVAFGSLARTMLGLDALVAEQWRQIWPETRQFTFDRPVMLKTTAEMAVVAAEWRSEGRSPDDWYMRRGRATLVLARGPKGLVCIHSHFSMLPGTPALGRDTGP